MEEREFLALADAELDRLDGALARLLEESKIEWDYEMKPGGIIEISFADDSRIIVNRHAAAREIWVAARSGGFHFRPPQVTETGWMDTRSGEDLPTLLSRCFSEQAGAPVQLAW